MTIRLAILLCLLSLPSWAMERAQSFCERGAGVIVAPPAVAAPPSQRNFMQSYPRCTVDVYLTGTTTHATIYSDSSGTALANPFTADQYGHWYFYAINGEYDVRISGGGLATPYTFGAVWLTDPARLINSGGMYVADQFPGADAGAKIQACLNELSSKFPSGGTCDARGIYGTQSAASTVTINASQRVLFGEIVLSGASNPIIQMAGTGASIACNSPGSSQIISTRATAGNPTGNTIAVTAGANSVSVEDCAVYTPTKTSFNQPVDEAAYKLGNAIYVDGSPGTITYDFRSSGNYISSGNNGVALNWNQRPQIHGNTFYNPSLGLAQLGFFGVDFGSVEGNTFTDAAGYSNAVYIRVSSDGSSNKPQLNNSVASNTFSGLYKFEVVNIIQGQNNSVTGNSVRVTTTANNSTCFALGEVNGNPTGGISGNSISGNSCVMTDAVSGGGVYGILVYDSSVSHPGALNNVISSNTVVTPGHGISLGAYASRTAVVGNSISSTGGIAGKDGILLTDTGNLDNSVTGNEIYGSTGNCINLQAQKSVVANNTAYGCASAGILIGKGQDSTVTGNRLIASGGFGISVASTDTGIIITNNRYVGNTGGTITGYVDANRGQNEYTDSYTSAKVGINTLPTYQLHVKQAVDGTPPIVFQNNNYTELRGYASSNVGGDNNNVIIGGYSSRGTLAAPAASQNGDSILRHDAYGYNGGYVFGGDIKAVVDGVPSGGGIPLRWEFTTSPVGGAPQKTFSVDGNGTFRSIGVSFSALPTSTAVNGQQIYCSDCTNASNPCTGAGTGAIAKRLNGAWDCR